MRRRAAASVAAAATLAAAASASAFTTDARRLAMGGVLAPGGSELAAANVAYQAMPPRRDGRGYVVPLPLGLVQLAADFPTFDSANPEYDVARIANLALNPPFFLELAPAEHNFDGDIGITIARNAFGIDFQDARELLPRAPIDAGGVYARPLYSLGLMGARSYVAPVVALEARIAFDDALYAALAQGEPLRPNSVYGLDANGESMVGTSFNVGWAGGGRGRDNGDGLYTGAFAKYILGFGFGRGDSRFTLATHDTIFGNSDPVDVGYDATTRVSRFGRFGNGIGFDVGAAYRMGDFDFGLGFRDIGAAVRWNSTEVQRTVLDEMTGQLVTTTVATGETYTSRLPLQTAINAGWSGREVVLAADLVTSRWGTMMHAGGERRFGPLALRAGFSTDERHKLQYAWGAGIGAAHMWVDLGFQTHSRSISGERGLTLGTSLAIR